MKFTAIFAIAIMAISSVGASSNTNAHRLARGLPPLQPRNFGSRVQSAKRSTPSNYPSQCSTGPVQCCNSTSTSDDGYVKALAEVLGIKNLAGTVGLNCTPVVGSQCTQQAVCCENNHFNGLISVNCDNVNL